MLAKHQKQNARRIQTHIPDNHGNHQRRKQQLHGRVMDQTHDVLCQKLHIPFSIHHLHVQNSNPETAAMPKEVIWIK